VHIKYAFSLCRVHTILCCPAAKNRPKAEEGGYRAEVPAIPGCATQGDTLAELKANLREAIAGCLSVRHQDLRKVKTPDGVLELAVCSKSAARILSPSCAGMVGELPSVFMSIGQR
jgi:predicted RNase H-like HicB family nuclease